MKFVLAFLLIFTVLTDLSVASFDMASCESLCDEASICSDKHLESHDSKENSDANSAHGCHNHAGHSHVAVLDNAQSNFSNSISDILVKFPKYQVQNINLYLNEISRPPIS